MATDPFISALADAPLKGPQAEAQAPAVLRSLASRRQKLLEYWCKHPWNWLTGEDVDGRPIIWTRDEKQDAEIASPIKAFPRKDYLKNYVEILHTTKRVGPRPGMVLVDKPRQMIISWTTLLWMDWGGRCREARRMLLSKSTEEEAVEMLRDKVREVQTHLPEWLQKALPQSQKPEKRVEYKRTKSYILAVAENVAEREARGGTASVVFVDEAARQMMFKDIVAASQPMVGVIVAVSTPEIGNPGAEYMKQILEI